MSIATSNRGSRLAAVSPLPDNLLDLAPESVCEASADLAAKLARLEGADAAARDAADAVEQAVAGDHSAAVKAVEADKPTPKAKAPAAREKATEAERNAAALVEVVNVAQNRLLAAVREAREQLADAATAELGDLARQAAEHVDRLEAALTRRRTLRGLLAALGDGGSLEGRAAEFRVNPARRRRRSDPLVPDDRRLLDDLCGRLGL
jgi:hypothetical protein